MKKFITRVVLFILLIAACDYAIGRGGKYAFNSSKSGINRKLKEIRDTSVPDIVIFGSSRAEHHYVTDILAESTGSGTYNMGIDGNGILLMYPYLSQLLTRHTPEVVIYDILPSYDLYDDNHEQYLKYLTSLHGLPEADSIMYEIAPLQRFKLYSHIYPFNSQYPSLVKGALSSFDSYSHGYIPISGRLPEENPRTILSGSPYSRLKLNILNRFISLCDKNDIRLIMTVSPFYGEFCPDDIEYISALCERNGIQFMDFSRHPDFISSPELFADTYHLNSEGAELFTRILADSIAQSHTTHGM